jgi:nitroreductase
MKRNEMIVDLLRRRASVRVFRDEPVPRDVIAQMVDAARLSPSGGNEQPWLFGIVTERRLIGAIADASYGQDWIASAPLVVVLCAVITADERGGRDVLMKRFPPLAESIAGMPKDLYAALTLEEHQTKIAGAHMALAALEHGVYSTWISLFDVDRVGGLLRLPAGVVPSEMLAFGYPGVAAGQKPKKSKGEVVFLDTFARPGCAAVRLDRERSRAP